MSEHTRRKFIKHASIGAAAVGATAVIPTMTSADAATPAADTSAAHDGPFTVWVKNVKTGELAVLVGEKSITHHDKALAKKLAQIAARGAKS